MSLTMREKVEVLVALDMAEQGYKRQIEHLKKPSNPAAEISIRWWRNKLQILAAAKDKINEMKGDLE